MTSASTGRRILEWFRRRGENVAAALLATIFVTFILQILFRYVLVWPVGWTLEISTLAWTWLVLWGGAFIVREEDEIRFDILYSAVPGHVRRGFIVVSSVALALLMIVSMPAAYDYVAFMRVERVSYVGLRLDHAFSIYVIFATAVIARCVMRIWLVMRSPRTDTAKGGEGQP